jgi:ADP-ribose pyrophosphatase
MSKTIFTGNHVIVLDRDGWEFVERKRAREAAVIFAETDDGRILLIEQFRKPVNARVIDFPAGLIGDQSQKEDPADTARRELEEETGFTCDHIELVGSSPSSPGITSEIIRMYRATGLTRQASGGGVEGEEITVHLVARDDIEPWLKRRESEGVLVDLKVWAGLYFLQNA